MGKARTAKAEVRTARVDLKYSRVSKTFDQILAHADTDRQFFHESSNRKGICYSFSERTMYNESLPSRSLLYRMWKGQCRATASTMWSPSERLCSNILRRHLPWVHTHQLSKQLCRVLLVTTDSCHEIDFLEAWRNIDESACVSTSFELVFFTLSHTNDLLLFLKQLDHIRSGFLERYC